MVLDVDAVAAEAFGLCEEYPPHEGPWHQHRRHQVIYAAAGMLRLECESGQWALPPQRAALIGAGVRHRTWSGAAVSLRTVYLSPSLFAAAELPPWAAFAVSPLCRELMLEAAPLGPAQCGTPVAQALFTLIARLLPRWLGGSLRLQLPRPTSDEVRRAVDHALSDLHGVTMASAAQAASMSERNLTRRFRDETGQSWRDFLRTARILRALELLASPGVRVTEVGFAVGFDSHAGFSRSFRELCGESPRDYQRRLYRGD